MDMKKYVLLTKNEVNDASITDSFDADNDHIFEVNDRGKIKKSCCGHFELKDDMREFIDYVAPMNAARMRKKVSLLGRKVCGRCVASLYGDRDTKRAEQNEQNQGTS